MNPLDWRKVATLVTQHKQEGAMAEMDQLTVCHSARYQLMTVALW